MGTVNITLNGKNYTAEAGATILETASANGVYIPTLCHFEGIEGRANCRMCVVEVEGMRTFQPACVTKIREGMVINTDTDRVRDARKNTLQLILAHHAVDCHHCLRIGSSSEQNLDPFFCEMCFWCDCVRDGFCELQSLAREYHVDVLPYIQHEADYEEDRSLGSIIRNPNKCIKCRRCVDVCGEVQTVHNLSMAYRGRDIMVVPEMGSSMDESRCVRCGHCADVCPTGAIYLSEHMDEILTEAHSYTVDAVAQLSDDVIPVLARLYKVDESHITGEKICAALHRNGFSRVISDAHARAVSASQAAEIIEKNIGSGTVMITSSSAVNNFVERFFPEMKKSIHAYDSPQKVFHELAGDLGCDKPVKTVNITDVREFGAEAEETGDADYVMNGRELYRMFLRSGGVPWKRRPEAFDKVWNDGEIPYSELLSERKWDLSDEVEEISVTIKGKECRCAVASNLGQVRRLLEGGYRNYDVIRLQA